MEIGQIVKKIKGTGSLGRLGVVTEVQEKSDKVTVAYCKVKK